MPNDNLKKYYSYLRSNGADVPNNFETFQNVLSDESNARKYHSYLIKNGFDAPESYDLFSNSLGFSKKKVSTVSTSKPKKEESSLDIFDKLTVKPSVSSGSKNQPPDKNIIKPKENLYKSKNKTYKLDESGAAPVWKEYSHTVFENGKQIEVYDKPIKNPSRVSTLNKMFGKSASSSEAEQVFTGYPGKEKNEYRIRDGVWQRKQSGYKNWEDLYSQGTITALNNQFKQNVKYNAARDKFSGVTEDIELKNKKTLDNNLLSVNTNLIGKEEEEVIRELRRKFPDFSFKQTGTAYGALTDEITVTSPYGGEPMTISLDNWSDDADNEEARKLRNFIKVNSIKKFANASKSLDITEEENKKEAGFNVNMRRAKPGDDEYIPDVAENMQPFVSNVKFVSKQEKIKLQEDERKARSEYAKAASEMFADVYDNQKEAIKTKGVSDDKDVVIQLASIPKDSDAIRRGNEFANDVKNSFKSYDNKVKELKNYSYEINRKLESGEITEEDFKNVYKPEIDKMSLNLNDMAQSLKGDMSSLSNVDRSINESIANQYIINEAKGSVAGGLAYKFVKGLTYLPRLISPEMDAKAQEDLVRDIVGGGTTKEYMESEERNDITKTLFSLSESMGALTSGAALGGGPATYAAFYGQSYYEMKDELDQVKGMSDAQKVLMSGAYGALSSVLEKFGIDFITQKTGFGKNITNNIMKSVFESLPKNASKEYIQAAIINDTKKYLTKLGIQTVGSGFVEGGTEGLQAATKVEIEEVYDLAKGTDYFNNKSGWEILSDIAYESYLGALGGGIMSTVSQSPKVISRGINSALNKEQIEVLFNSAKYDIDVTQALLTNLKVSILSGKISKEEAKNIASSYQDLKAKIETIPEEYSIVNKSVALDLMLEKDRLNKQIQGKDQNLVKPVLDRITEIDNQLTKIGENAVKESTEQQQEVTAEGGGVQYQRTDEGQPEVGQGEGPVGETAQPETDLGNRPVEGRGIQEEVVIPSEEDITIDEEVNRLRSLLGEEPKFQKGEQAPKSPVVESVVEEMNAMPEDVAKFDIPSDLTTKNKTNIGSLINRFGDKLQSTFKGGVIKNISEYNGIPMIFTISDQLTSGSVKNPFTGNTIDVNGGIGFNLTEGNEGSAWANTSEGESVKMLNRAKEVYSKNKDLFSRLWSEGKLPQGQVPMAIVKMGQDSIQTNEALFRFAADTIKKKFNKTERINSLNGLIEDISAVNPKSKVVSFIKENNFKTIDELLDNMNNLKPIGERANVSKFLFTGGIQLDKETKPGKPRSKSGLALVGDKDSSYYKYIHLQTINNAIQDESTKSVPSSHIIGITGVDVLNPEITNPKHRNYPYGVKGGLIGILESPIHAADVFPEMYSKTFYLQKENATGKSTPSKVAVEQAVAPSGFVASIKAFRGAKLSTKMTELQKLLGKLRLAFPSVTVVDTQQEFENALNNPDVRQFVKDGEIVYGFTKDGKVFLNPEKANSNTAIHEFSHIWMNFLKENNPSLLQKGYSLLEGTEILQRKVNELGDVELAREEAMAELIANKGESLIEAGVKSKFKNWLNAVFTYIKNKFKAFDKLTPEELQNMNLNDFVDGSLASILGGKEITSKEIKSMSVMFSKGTPIDKVVSVAKENNISDASIRKYLKDNGYSDKEATDAINKYNFKKEDIWIAREGTRIDSIKSSIQSFRKRLFSARSFLPKSVFKYKEIKEAEVAKQLNIVDQNVSDFNKLYDKYPGDKKQKEKLLSDFDSYIRGGKDVKLPNEFKLIADSMRNQIDNLSTQLIDNGLVDADMAQTIKDNLGQYLTRSYKIYDRDNWKKEVEDEVKQQARNFLRAQYRSMAEEISSKEGIPVDEVLDNIVDNKMDEMLTTDGASNFIKGSKLGSKDLSVLKERQDIPFEIRALMGEYSDPALNYAKTVLKLSSLAANHKFLTEVKKSGMGIYLFEKNDPRRPKDFNTKIAPEKSKTMNPLDGLYTTKEIAAALETQPSQLSDFMKLFMKFQSSIRWGKTIGSIATHMKNVIGNLGFVWINGHFNRKEISSAYKTVKNDFSKKNKQELRDKMNEYISLGIVKQSAGLGEIMDMFKDADWDTAMASRLSNQKIGLLGKAKRLFLQGKKKLEDAYQAEDDFFKILAYEMEKSRYSKAMFDKNKNDLTQDELNQVNDVVTEIVKNTYPTYDRIPEAVKMIRRAPFIGNFVSFQAEAYRTAWNTMVLAKQELASDNPKIKTIGAQRLAGATTYVSAKTAILQYYTMAAGAGLTGVMGYLFDDDDEEKRDKDIRNFVAPWSKESDLIIKNVGNGKINYIDFSASDPHGGIKKAMNAFLLGESTSDSFIDGLISVVSPFVGEEMTTEALLELKNNQDKYGKQIWNPEESWQDISKNILAHMYKLIEPGTISSIRRGLNSDDKTKELVSNITGFRPYDVDVAEQFGFKMRDYSDRIKDAKRIYNSTFYKEDATEEDKQKAYDKANKSLKKIYKEIKDIYNSAERLGAKKEDLEIKMKDFGGIAKYKIEEIRLGEIEDLIKKEEE